MRVSSVVEELRRFKDLVHRDHGRFRKKWLVFHGTASPALYGIVKAGGVVPWNVLRARRLYTVTGEQFYTLEAGGVLRQALSVTRDPELAKKYSRHSAVVSQAVEEDILSTLRIVREEIRNMRYGSGDFDWEAIHTYMRSISPRIQAMFSKQILRNAPIYPVIVGTVAVQRNFAKHYAPYAVTEPEEELIVQMPIHKSYFFVPREYVQHARSVLSRRGTEYADRVFSMDVLNLLFSKKKRVS